MNQRDLAERFALKVTDWISICDIAQIGNLRRIDILTDESSGSVAHQNIHPARVKASGERRLSGRAISP